MFLLFVKIGINSEKYSSTASKLSIMVKNFISCWFNENWVIEMVKMESGCPKDTCIVQI